MFEDISPWPSPPSFSSAGESAHGASRRPSTLPSGLSEFSPLLSPSSAPLPHSLATLTGPPTSCAFSASSFSPQIGAGPSCTQGGSAARQRLQEIKELDLLQREEKIQRQLTLLQEEQRQREAAQERGGFLGEETVLLGRNNRAQSGGAADLEEKQKQAAAGVCPPHGGTGAGRSNTSINGRGCQSTYHPSAGEKEGNVRVEIYGARQPLNALQSTHHGCGTSVEESFPFGTHASGCCGESQRMKPGDGIRGVSPGGARDDPTHALREVENIQHRSDDRNRFSSRHFPSLLDSLNEDPLSLSHLCGNSSMFLSSSSLLSLGFLGSSGGSPTDACTTNPCLASAPRALSSPQGPESALSFSPSPPKSTRSPTLLQCEWATAPQPLSPSLRGVTGKPNQAEGSWGPAARRSFSCRNGMAARGRTDSNGRQRSSSAAPGASSPGAVIFEFSARAIEERETPQSAGRQALNYVPPSPQARDICPPHKHLAQQLKLRERKQQERLQRLQRQQLREEERKIPVQARGQSQKTGEAVPRPRAGRALSGGGRARMLTTSPGSSGTASRVSTAATMPTQRKATLGTVTGVLLSLSAHPSAKASVPSLADRARDKQPTPGVSSPPREARHDSLSRRVTSRRVAPKTGTTRRGLQEDLPRSKAASANATQQASFAVGEQIAMVPPRTAGVKNSASATLRRKGAEDKERQGGISEHIVPHTSHPETRLEDRTVSPFVGRSGGTSAFGSTSLADGAGSAREGDCSTTKRKDREAKPSAPAHSASPIRFSAGYAKASSTPTRRKDTSRKVEAKKEPGTALVVCAKGLQRAKVTPVREKGCIEANQFGERERNESGRVVQLTNVSTEGEDDCEIRLRQILQKLRARLLERKTPNDDGSHPSGEGKNGKKRVPVTGDTDGRRTTEEASRGGRDDAPRYEEAAGQEHYSLDCNSPTFGTVRAKSGVRKEERRLPSSSGYSERMVTHREPIYGEKEVTERETAGACRRQGDKKACQATGKVHTRSSTDSRERELRTSESDSSGDSDSSGWSIVERLRRILRGEGKKRRHAELGVFSAPCRRGRGQQARKRESSLSSSGSSAKATGGSWRRRRRRSGRREARRLLKRVLWHKDGSSSPASTERRTRSCRSRWRSPWSSPSSHTSSTSPRQSTSSLLSSSLPSSVCSTVSPRSRASPLSASFASSISSGSSPSLITKWLHYSAALLQSQGGLTDSGVAWMSPPEQTLFRPATEAQRRTRGERDPELSRPNRGKETSSREHKQGGRRTKKGEEQRRRRGSPSSSSRRLRVTEGSVYKANVVTGSGEDRQAGEKRSYNPLTEDPEEVVRRIKKRLGLPVSPRRDSSRPSSVHSSPSYASCSPGGNRQLKRSGGTERVAMGRTGRLRMRLAEEQDKGHSLDADSLFLSTGRVGVIRDPRGQRRGKGDMLLSGDKGVSLRVHSSPNIHSFEIGEGTTGRNEGSRTPSRRWQPLSSLSLSLSSSSVPGSPSTQADTGPGAKRECGREVAFPISDRLEQDEKARDRLRHPSSGSLHLSLSASTTREENKSGKTRKRTGKEKEGPQATRVETVSVIQSEERAAPQKMEESPPPSKSRAAHERVSLSEEAKKDSRRDADQLNLRPNSSQSISSCVFDEESAGEEDRGETQIPTGPGSPDGRGSQKLPAEKGQRDRVRERASKEGKKLPSDHLASRSRVSGCDDPDGPLRISALLNSLSQSFGEAAAAGTVSSAPAPKETNVGESFRSRSLSPSDAAQHDEGSQAKSPEGEKQETTNSMARTRGKEDSHRMISESVRLKTNDLQRECINRHDTIPQPSVEVPESSASSRERGEGTLGEGVGDKPHMKTETPLSVSFAPILREEKELSKEQVCLENVPYAVEREEELAARASKTHDVSLLPQAPCPSVPGAESEETHQEGDLGSTLSAQLADIQQLQSLLAEADALERSHASLLLRGDNGGACEGSWPRAEGGKGVKETDLHEPREEEAREPRNRRAARSALNQVTMQECPEERQGSPVQARREDSSCADGLLPVESRQEGNSGRGSFSEKAVESTTRIQEAMGDEAGRQRGENELGEQEREQESKSDGSWLDRQAIPQNVALAQVEEARSLPVDENRGKEKLLTEAERCLKAGDAFARMCTPGSSEGSSCKSPIALHERTVQPRGGSEERHKEGAGVLESQRPGSTLSDISHSGTLCPDVAPRGRCTLADGCEGEERRQQPENEVALPKGDSLAPAKRRVGSFLSEGVQDEQHLPLAATEIATSCVTGRQNLPGDRESAVVAQMAESYSDLSNATSLGETDPTKPKNPAVTTGAACRGVEANSTGASGTTFQAVDRVQMPQSEVEEREQPREQDEAKDTSGKAARESNDCDAGSHRGETHRAAPSQSSLLPMLTNLLQKHQPLLRTLLDHLQQNQDTSNSDRDAQVMPVDAGHTPDVQKSQGDSSGGIQKCTQAKPSNVHGQTLILQDRGVPHTLSLIKNTRALQLTYPSLFVMQSPPSGVCIHLGGAAGEASLREHASSQEERNCQSGVAEKDRSLVSALTHQRVKEVADGRTRENPAVNSCYDKKQETQTFHVKSGNGSHLTTVTALEEARNKTLGEGRKDAMEKEEPQNLGEARERHRVSLDGELDEGQSFGKGLASDENTKSEQEGDTEGEEASMQMTELEHLLQCIGALQSLVSSGVLGKKNVRARESEFSEYDESRHRETDDHDCYAPLPRFSFDFGEEREQKSHVFGGAKSLERKGVGRMPRPAQRVLRARESSGPPTVERRKWVSEDLFLDREDHRLEAFLEARRENLDRDLGFNLLFSGMTHDTGAEEREVMEILRLMKRSEKGRTMNSWNRNFGHERCSQDRWYSWGGEEAYREQRRRLHEFVQRELEGEED